ncbi:MAG: hypothetical protein MPF33_06380 [Candidatus Aramenus sp.]|jgi:hypothetical protein|nr:hypothetical protein [Candidatus Aramenus sp.]
MNKEKREGDVKERRDESYYYRANKSFEDENELDNSAQESRKVLRTIVLLDKGLTGKTKLNKDLTLVYRKQD